MTYCGSPGKSGHFCGPQGVRIVQVPLYTNLCMRAHCIVCVVCMWAHCIVCVVCMWARTHTRYSFSNPLSLSLCIIITWAGKSALETGAPREVFATKKGKNSTEKLSKKFELGPHIRMYCMHVYIPICEHKYLLLVSTVCHS